MYVHFLGIVSALLMTNKHLLPLFHIILIYYAFGGDIVQAISRWVPTAATRVRAKVRSCGICSGQSGIGTDSEYFGISHHSFHQLLHTHYHLSSGAGTTGQIVTDIPSGLSQTTPHKTKM
jgi:hypothetical protein